MTIQLIGKKSGVKPEVETNTLAMRTVFRARDFQMRGAYAAAVSGSGANATNVDFFNGAQGSGPFAILKRLTFSAGVAASAAANIVTVTATFRRATANTGPGLSSKLRMSFPEPYCSLLTASAIGTADARAIWNVTASIPAVAGSKTVAPFDVLDLLPDRYLLVEPGHAVAITVSFVTNVTMSLSAMWEEHDLLN